ncbi:AraC family transcriptional regulator [Rhodococcus oxybenzonivorans]|uniref:AraC family transcriptional regulator n=1 Tax=Rhodococcus oxybenzonivorans TaxID=1990687 RepID=UPI001E415AED|nr:helix-turn-helix domain-containing protein [Rhodococcus oxybenzonivorans]
MATLSAGQASASTPPPPPRFVNTDSRPAARRWWPHVTPPRSLTDIATQFGFVDLSVFSGAFTATHGISPSRYREQHR